MPLHVDVNHLNPPSVTAVEVRSTPGGSLRDLLSFDEDGLPGLRTSDDYVAVSSGFDLHAAAEDLALGLAHWSGIFCHVEGEAQSWSGIFCHIEK